MKRHLPLLAILALLFSALFSAAIAQAEYRTVLVQLKRDKDQTTVSISSDEKKERKTNIPVAEASEILEKMKGWGSSVGVYVTHDGRIPGGDLKKIFSPICDNLWLDLLSYGTDVPPNVKEHFLQLK